MACLLLPVWARGQTRPTGSKPLLDLNGHVNLYTDMFFSSNRALSDRLMHRPGYMQRLSAGFGFEVLGFQIPTKINLTLPVRGFGVNALPNPNLLQYLRTPVNGIGFFPEKGSFKGSLGAFNTQVSKLTAGNIAYAMGVGAKVNVLFMRVEASVGMTHQEIGRDSALGILGSHPRYMGTVRVGMGDEKKSHLYLNFVRVKDDTIWDRLPRAQAPTATPQDGSVLSADMSLRLSKRLSTQAEYAISAFTADQRAAPFPAGVLPPNLRTQIESAGRLILFNTNTRFGTAMDAKAEYKTKRMTLGARLETRDLGFHTLAFYRMVTDYQNLTGTFKRKFWDGRLSTQASAGLNVNNRSGAKASTTTQAIYNYSAHLALFKGRLQLGANGANFGLTVVTDDTVPIQRMLSDNLNAYASLSLGKSIQHHITLSGSSMAFEDRMDLAGTVLPASTQSLNVYHQVTFPSHLGFNVGFNGFRNDGIYGTNQRTNLSVGFQHQLWKNKLRVNGQFRYSDGQNDPSGTGKVYALVGSASLDLNKRIRFKLRCDVRRQWITSEYVTLGFFSTEAAYKF